MLDTTRSFMYNFLIFLNAIFILLLFVIVLYTLIFKNLTDSSRFTMSWRQAAWVGVIDVLEGVKLIERPTVEIESKRLPLSFPAKGKIRHQPKASATVTAIEVAKAKNRLNHPN